MYWQRSLRRSLKSLANKLLCQLKGHNEHLTRSLWYHPYQSHYRKNSKYHAYDVVVNVVTHDVLFIQKLRSWISYAIKIPTDSFILLDLEYPKIP